MKERNKHHENNPGLENQRLLRVSEVASILYFSPSTVRKLSDRGILRAYRFGPRGDRRIVADSVEEFRQREYGNGNPPNLSTKA